MDITLDKDVYTRDGEKVGTVDRVTLHPDSMEISGIIVHEGLLFTQDRVIDREFIDRVDQDGNVHLNIDRDREKDLPPFAEGRFVEPTREQREAMHNIIDAGASGSGGRLLVVSEAATTSPHPPAPESPMEAAPVDPAPMEQQSNLPPGTVTIHEGTDVIDVDGEKIGTVGEVIYDDNEQIEAIIVEEGVLFSDHVRIPVDWIAGTAHDHILINRSGKEAEQAGQID